MIPAPTNHYWMRPISFKCLEQRQGLKIGSPEEIAWRMGLINSSQLEKLASPQVKSGYGEYLLQILDAELA